MKKLLSLLLMMAVAVIAGGLMPADTQGCDLVFVNQAAVAQPACFVGRSQPLVFGHAHAFKQSAFVRQGFVQQRFVGRQRVQPVLIRSRSVFGRPTQVGLFNFSF